MVFKVDTSLRISNVTYITLNNKRLIKLKKL